MLFGLSREYGELTVMFLDTLAHDVMEDESKLHPVVWQCLHLAFSSC